jgi:hypothetical protein
MNKDQYEKELAKVKEYYEAEIYLLKLIHNEKIEEMEMYKTHYHALTSVRASLRMSMKANLELNNRIKEMERMRQ